MLRTTKLASVCICWPLLCVRDCVCVQVVRLGIDRQRCSAMVQYESIDVAKEALSGVKGTFIGNSRRIMVS